MAMKKTNLSIQIRKDLKVSLKRNLIQPHHYREFFLIGTGANVMIQQNKGYYDLLLNQKDHYPPNYFDKIKQDVVRSIPSNSVQKEEKQKLEESLDNILSAIAIRNPYIHYCQGMNFVGLFILKHITIGNEEEAFWIFVQLLETVLSLEMYNNPEFFVYYLNMIEEYIKLESSDIYDKIKKTQTQFLVYPFSEIFTLFTNQIQPEITFVIWMNLILGGQRVLFKSMIALLHINRTELLKAENFGQFNSYLQTIRTFNDKDQFLKEFYSIYINKRVFNMALNQYSEKQKQAAVSDKQNMLFNSFKENCDTNQPICIHVQKMIKLLNRSFSFFIYKTKNKIEPKIVDYFSSSKNQDEFNKQHQYISNQQDFEHLDDLLVGRFHHMCEAIEYKKNGQLNMLLSRQWPQMGILNGGFMSPQISAIAKSNDSDNDSELSLQDRSQTHGTDPILKKSTFVKLQLNREKSKTHSNTCSNEYEHSDQLIQDLIHNQNNRKNSNDYSDENQNYFLNCKNQDENDDEDGNFTYMFDYKKESPETLVYPRRRKSINWINCNDNPQKQDQLSEGVDSSLSQQQNQKVKSRQSEQNDIHQTDENSASTNYTIRSRSSYVFINTDIQNKLINQVAAASQKISPQKEKQKIYKY